MRLIDADEFRRHIDSHYPFSKAEQSRHGIADVAKSSLLLILLNEPTVDAVPVIRCKDCKWFSAIGYCDLLRFRIVDSYKYCAWAERKDEYVTLHHEDIHFIDEDAERAFYESLTERTRSFTDEEWEFYKKVNREKMQKTNLNIYDLLNKKEE